MNRRVPFSRLHIFSAGAWAAFMAATDAPRAAVAQRMQPVIVQGFCVSSTAPTVYVTGVVELQTRTAAAGALSVFQQFSEYLRGRYDLDKTPLGVSCQPEPTRTTTIAQLSREGKQIVQVDWKPIVTSFCSFRPTASAPTVRLCFRRDRGSMRTFRSRRIQDPSRFRRRFAATAPTFRPCCRFGS